MERKSTSQYAAMLSRRQWLQGALFGSAMLAFRAMASGIPPSVLLSPRHGLLGLSDEAVQQKIDATRAQFLVLSASDSGEPINCNVPGTFDDPNILHPSDVSMAPITFSIGNTSGRGSAVWGSLPDTARARLSFFHHATNSIAHGDFSNVHSLYGAVPNHENLMSAMGKILQEPLGAIQHQPVNIGVGAPGLSVGGVAQPAYSPTSIKTYLTAPSSLSQLNSLTSLRDKTLEQMHAMVSNSGTSAQRQLLDAWATSQQQARQLSAGVVAQLSAISDNTIKSQMVCATLLCALKLAPSVMVTMSFGGDNHADVDPHLGLGKLPGEQGSHVTAMAAINAYLQSLGSLGLSDKITFATLSTFGRTNCRSDYHGRTHNSGHTASILLGANVRGSVIGGVTLQGINLTASNIDSQSGMASAGGDIGLADGLNAFASTLASACGIDDASIKATVSPGTKVSAALA